MSAFVVKNVEIFIFRDILRQNSLFPQLFHVEKLYNVEKLIYTE